MGNGTRAFIAVDIPLVVRKKMIQVLEDIDCDAVRPVREDQIHITLLFLGMMNDTQLKGMTKALSQLGTAGFGLLFNGIGSFSEEKPRVIFANIIEGEAELSQIYSTLKAKASALGIKTDDRGFAAHATIARVKEAGTDDILYLKGFVASHSEDEFGGFHCNEVKLKSSVLKSDGPEYSDIFVKDLSP